MIRGEMVSVTGHGKLDAHSYQNVAETLLLLMFPSGTKVETTVCALDGSARTGLFSFELAGDVAKNVKHVAVSGNKQPYPDIVVLAQENRNRRQREYVTMLKLPPALDEDIFDDLIEISKMTRKMTYSYVTQDNTIVQIAEGVYHDPGEPPYILSEEEAAARAIVAEEERLQREVDEIDGIGLEPGVLPPIRETPSGIFIASKFFR